MRDRIIQFTTLVVYMCVLNFFFFLVGILFIPDYTHWSASKLNFWHFFLIAIYSFIQTIVFPLIKKRNIIIFSFLSLICGLLLTYCDTDGFGNEIWCDIVLSISKCNHFLGLLFLNHHHILLRANFTFFYSVYIIMVGYSFNFLYKKIFSPFFLHKSNQT